MQLNVKDLNPLQAGVREQRSNVWKFKPTRGSTHLPLLVARIPEVSGYGVTDRMESRLLAHFAFPQVFIMQQLHNGTCVVLSNHEI